MNKGSNYVRKFIILKTQYSNIKDLNQKGHGRLESRGQNLNISFNIEGAESTNYYDILLIGEEKAHRLGSIYTEENRNGRVEFNILQKDLEKWGFPLKKINGILIIRNSKILLGGYFQTPDGSIDKYIRSMGPEEIMEQEVIEEIVEEKTEDIETEDIEEEDKGILLEEEIEDEGDQDYFLVEEAVEDQGEDIEEDIIEEKIQEYGDSEALDLASQEVEEINIPEELIEELIEEDRIEEDEIVNPIDEKYKYSLNIDDIISKDSYQEVLEDVFPQEIDISPDYYENFYIQDELNNMDESLDNILNILNYFPYTEPFKLSLGGYSWWKIGVEDPALEKSFLPYFDYMLNRDYNHPIMDTTITAYELIKKYRHYIFGMYQIRDGVKLYIYGIPGSFKMDEYPQRGTTGFNTWFEAIEVPGYWLIYVDPSSGRIIYPVNPMIPTE